MFGYIKPCKPEMKVKEFDTFQAIYCGLCKQLSHVYGPFASLTLSYDFTFAATVALGLRTECPGYRTCTCTANLLKKKTCLAVCADLQYCASVAMLMIYFKLRDDIQDSGFLRRTAALLALPFAAAARRKARRLYPDIDAAIQEAMRRQAQVERAGCTSPDAAADPTAAALAAVFEALSDDPRQKQVLHRFGYLTGRYVYFADALDDLEKDQKRRGYNPFLQKFSDTAHSLRDIREYAQQVLNLTIGELAPAYELLELKRYKSILDNIIYLGLHQEIRTIRQKAEQPHTARSKKEQAPFSDSETEPASQKKEDQTYEQQQSL